MPAVEAEARRRGIKLVALPTEQACHLLGPPSGQFWPHGLIRHFLARAPASPAPLHQDLAALDSPSLSLGVFGEQIGALC